MIKKYSYISIIENESIKNIQNKIYQLTGSKLYQTEWPLHITVGAGICIEENDFNKISSELEKIANINSKFHVNLTGILFKKNLQLKKINSAYEPYVVYIGVDVSDQLQKLVKQIDTVLRKYNIWFEIMPYHPHITIAGRDITKERFNLLQKEFANKTFSATIEIENFSMVLAPSKENNFSPMKKIKIYNFNK